MKLIEDVIARGRWKVDGYGPLTCLDPPKLRHLLGLKPIKDPGSIIPFSHVQRLEQRIPWRELRKLMVGANLLFPTDAFANIVVNQGLNHLLDVTLSGATQDVTWFVGLTDGTPTVAAADTLASHAGWVERTEYDEINRVAYVDAGAASQSLTNSASPAAFTINATVTVGGAFLSGSNTGTTLVLYAAGAFTAGDKSLNDNDTLSVTATFTAAAT